MERHSDQPCEPGRPVLIVDLFAGPRGWSEGLRALGLTDIGVEWDRWACATAVAAGHRTIQADVEELDPADFAPARAVIASPPCQWFSDAGPKAGHSWIEQVCEHAAAGALLGPEVPQKVRLVLEALRWVHVLDPEWIAFEQVPRVLPIWEACAVHLAERGYSTWVGVLNAADYGVPQARKRAVLIASRQRTVTRPAPSHDLDPARSLLTMHLDPWVTMAQALPHRTDLPAWCHERPATTVVGTFCPEIVSPPGYRTTTSRQNAEGGVRTTIEERLALQSFRPDYPVQGPKASTSLQVGNAVPPLLAAHVAAEATGLPLGEAGV